MRFQHAIRFTMLLGLLILAGLGGCNDDDNPTGGGLASNENYGTGLVGTWVAYQGLENGAPEQDGGTHGAGGTVIVFNENGTGSMVEIDVPGTVDNFTWTAENGTMLVDSQSDGPRTVTYIQSGDMFSYTVPEGQGTYTEVYQRYRGAGVLTGTWQYLEAIDDFVGYDVSEAPHTLSFDGKGTSTFAYEGRDPSSRPYSTNTYRLTLGTSTRTTYYTVVGTTLHIFQFWPANPPLQADDIMFIIRYQKL